MTKRYIYPAIVLVVVGLTIFGVSPRSDWPMVGAVVAMVGLLVAALMTPAIRGLARSNKNVTRVAGLISIGFAIFALVAGLVGSPPIFSANLTTGIFAILSLVGLLLFQLPAASANVDSALDAQKVAARVRPNLGDFHTLEEVKGAYAFLWRNKTSLARVSGPWLLASCALPILLFHPDFWNGVIG